MPLILCLSILVSKMQSFVSLNLDNFLDRYFCILTIRKNGSIWRFFSHRSFLAFEPRIWGKSVGLALRRWKMFETKSTLKKDYQREFERESERDWETMRHKQQPSLSSSTIQEEVRLATTIIDLILTIHFLGPQ